MSNIGRTIELGNIDSKNRDRSHTSISLGWELVLGERIGSGANGDVYIGKIIGDNTSEEVAVKYPNRDPNSIKSLREEVQISSQLVHSYIAKTRLLDESDGNPKIIMDYIDGHNLSTIGKKHNDLALRFPQKLTALIGWLCSQGLDYAHNNTFKDLEDNSVKGAIHRDLSPNNLIIDNNEGTPFIIDFGTAVLSTDTPKIIGKRSGTLGYAAYETLRGDQIDHRVDIYGLGMMMYTLINSHNPFLDDEVTNTNNVLDAIKKVMELQERGITPLSSLPNSHSELSDIIDICTRKDRDERYSSALELKSKLGPYLFRDGEGPFKDHLRIYLDLIFSPEFSKYIKGLNRREKPTTSPTLRDKIMNAKSKMQNYMVKDGEFRLESLADPGYIAIG